MRRKIDLVRASIVKIGQLAKSSLKMNRNGSKWKQRTELKPTGTPTVCKFMNVQAQHKEMRDSLQPRNRESGQEDTSHVEQNKHLERDRTSEGECCP
jgi:hypothetical protein